MMLPSSPGASATRGSAGSYAANMRMPPVCLVMTALAVKELAPPDTQPLMQPSSQPTRMRPSLSIDMSKKSSWLRQVPEPQTPLWRWTGSPGVTFWVVQVAPPSKVVAT